MHMKSVYLCINLLLIYFIYLLIVLLWSYTASFIQYINNRLTQDTTIIAQYKLLLKE